MDECPVPGVGDMGELTAAAVDGVAAVVLEICLNQMSKYRAFSLI